MTTIKATSRSPAWYGTLLMAYKSLGVVYGGLATSPLYLYPSINMANAAEEDYLGLFSIIFWTLTLVGVLKYALLVLRADNQGEGGTYVLYTLLTQHASISTKLIGNRVAKIEALSLSPPSSSSSTLRSKLIKVLESSRAAQTILFMAALLGSVMLIADGVLTPAISVLSAMSGLKNASPSITQDAIVWITLSILVVLFLLQRFGTERVSILFSPLMITWLLINLFIGTYNVIMYYPRIFKALSPAYCLSFFLRHGTGGWLHLAGTALCISGVEAMYADMGHFDRKSIQVGFLLGVYPSNIITYAGQTAFYIKHPAACNDLAYYNVIPNILIWPILVISTLAAIVASQSLISACFSLVKQSMEQEQFPRVDIIHTSKSHEGQVYSPQINYALLFLCLAVVLGFRSGVALGNAYGVTVVTVVFLTTLLFSMVLLVVWRASLLTTFCYLAFFGVVEGSYLVAVLTGMPRGGWLPFLLALAFAIIMWSWIYGRSQKRQYELANQIKADDFPSYLSSANVTRVPGVGILYTATPDFIPAYLHRYLDNMGTIHRLLVLVSIQVDRHLATLIDTNRFLFDVGPTTGVYTCAATYGYAETLDWSKASEQIVSGLESYIRATCNEDDEDGRSISRQALEDLETSRQLGGPVHVIGNAVLVSAVGKGSNPFKRLLIDTVYRFVHKNCSSSMPFFATDGRSQFPPKLLEIGTLCPV